MSHVREQPFTVVREDWSEYELGDGTRVRVKLVVRKMFRQLDSDGQPDSHPDGEPKIQVSHAIIVTAAAAEPQPVAWPPPARPDEPVH